MADTVDYTGVVWGDSPETTPVAAPTEVNPTEAAAPTISTESAPAEDTAVDYTGVVWGDNPEATSADGIPEITITAPRLNAPEQVEGAPREGVLDFLKTTVQNVPGSAYNLGAGVLNAAMHPIETAKTTGMAVGGGAQNVYNLVAPAIGLPKADVIDPTIANQVGQMFVDRYGSGENILNTLKTDPVGFIADASAVLTGGGSAVGALGKVGQLGEIGSMAAKAGGVATKVGEAINPANIAGKTVGALADIPLGKKTLGERTVDVVQSPVNALAQTVGLSSSLGGQAVKDIFDIGRQGGKLQETFSDVQSGRKNVGDAITDTEKFLKNENLSVDQILKRYAGTSEVPSDLLDNLRSVASSNPVTAPFAGALKEGMTKWELNDIGATSRQILDEVEKRYGVESPQYKAADEFWGEVQNAIPKVKDLPTDNIERATIMKIESAKDSLAKIKKSIADDDEQHIINRKIDKLREDVKAISTIGEIPPVSAAWAGQKSRNLLPERLAGFGDISTFFGSLGAMGGHGGDVGKIVAHALSQAAISSPRVVGTGANVAGKAYGLTEKAFVKPAISLSKYIADRPAAYRPFEAAAFANQYAQPQTEEQQNALSQYVPQMPYAPRWKPTQ